jgi:hypothetical protein
MSSTAATNTFIAPPTDTPPPPPLGPSQAGTVPGQGPAKLHLYTAGTPNGYKVSILLEELRAAYPDLAARELSYDVSALEIWKNQQKVRGVSGSEARLEARRSEGGLGMGCVNLLEDSPTAGLWPSPVLSLPPSATTHTTAPRIPRNQPQRPHSRAHRRQLWRAQDLREREYRALARGELW